MTKKISELPAATTPLSGTEVLPLMQSGVYRKAGIGVAQILEPFGDLPTDMPIGKVIYVPDAAGGAVPAYWNGTAWLTIGDGTRKRKVKPMGEGVFVIGIGPSEGLANLNQFDAGYYCFSRDGIYWEIGKVGPVPMPALNAYLAGGISNTAYANGAFLFTGFSDNTDNPYVKIIQTHDPTDNIAPTWLIAPPFGHSDAGVTEAVDASAYNEPTGEFTVGPVTIWNPLPRAATPNPAWPWAGKNEGEIVEGVGSSGPVEIKVGTTQITVLAGKLNIIPDDMAPFLPPDQELTVPTGMEGTYLTDYISVKRAGTSTWQAPTGPARYLLSAVSFGGATGEAYSAAGLSLRGLIWGPMKDSAVRFLPGGN